MSIDIRNTPYRGWRNNVRISNGQIELIVTADVGPRVIRLGFVKGRNLMAEFKDQMGGQGEKEWMIRGGHRLWLAPEAKPETYELDNRPITIRTTRDGIRTLEPVGALTGVQKLMDIQMESGKNVVTITHTLKNTGRKPRTLAPWALTVMAPGGTCIIPLPKKIAHSAQLLHNQEWSIWGYTDFADGRWTIGKRYVFFRQDRRRGPGKLGIAHREGWVAYQLGDCLFAKQFQRVEGAVYPDGGVNFETFSNEQMLEVETLGPLVTLKSGQSVRHVEVWKLLKGLKPIKTEADADAVAKKLLR
jgi:hypothetical protein